MCVRGLMPEAVALEARTHKGTGSRRIRAARPCKVLASEPPLPPLLLSIMNADALVIQSISPSDREPL